MGVSREIKISTSRPARDIVREIARKIMPGYLAAIETTRKRKAEAESFQHGREQVARELATMASTKIGRPESAEFTAQVAGCYLKCRVNSATSVNLDISHVSPEQARRILEIIKG